MRVAVTADAHLRTVANHPERYNALENVFEQTVAAGIEHLIIAGDLFNEDVRNYSEFEAICRKHSALEMHIIPGNHDPSISGKSITGSNVHIYTEPTVVEFEEVTFLFIPFEENTKMGEKIAPMESEIAGKPWVLIGHGDFYGGVTAPNPLERGTYMPLSRNDLGRFKPRTVFLGHIHKAHSPVSDVTYVGSPCGLDISETGQRRFVVYDTETGRSEDRVIVTDVLYFSRSFLVLPRESEVTRLKQDISDWIESWEISPADQHKVRIRVEARGYAKDRGAVLQALEVGLGSFAYYNNEGPEIDDLSVSTDDQLEAIAEHAIKRIAELDWPFDGDEPNQEQVEIAALSVIYGN